MPCYAIAYLFSIGFNIIIQYHYHLFNFGCWFVQTYVKIRGIGIVKGKPFDPTAFNALILPSLALMKSMSGQIDYGVGPKPERVKAIMQETQHWEGKIAPKPNLIVITIPHIFPLLISCDLKYCKSVIFYV